jgi:hypothetical protein
MLAQNREKTEKQREKERETVGELARRVRRNVADPHGQGLGGNVVARPREAEAVRNGRKEKDKENAHG